MVYLTNAFSLTMIQSFPVTIEINEISETEVKNILDKFVSAIGHESTAQLLSSKLNKEITFNRISITLTAEDILIVAQLMGPRKEYKDMTVEEIQNYPIKYFLIKIK